MKAEGLRQRHTSEFIYICFYISLLWNFVDVKEIISLVSLLFHASIRLEVFKTIVSRQRKCTYSNDFACGQSLHLFITGYDWDKHLVPWPGIEPWPPALGEQSLSHWTTREVPQKWTLIIQLLSRTPYISCMLETVLLLYVSGKYLWIIKITTAKFSPQIYKIAMWSGEIMIFFII